MEPVDQYYIEKNILADDEKSIIKDDLSIDESLRELESIEDDSKDIIPESSVKTTEKDLSLKDKLKSDVTKTIVNTLTGNGLPFNRIKIDENLLKKNILKVRYINSNRRVNNKFLENQSFTKISHLLK